MTELQIQRCESCGTHLFPARLRCPSCGGGTMRWVAAGQGLVEEETTLRRPDTGVRLGSIQLDAGPIVIARLAPTVGAGVEVRLEELRNGAIQAQTIERST